MNSPLLTALACVSLLPYPAASADIQLGSARVHFASQSEGGRILTEKDEFIQRLGPFDRSARMKTDKPVSEAQFLEFVRRNVVDWTPEEVQTVRAALEGIQTSLRDFPLSLSPTVQLIKTTGFEEGNAAYTRATAIVIPKSELAKSQKDLQKLICHELFHILSRHNPWLRERLYGVIGFAKCNEIDLPPELKRRKITNPDAPRNGYYIRLQIDGRESCAVPILLSSAETYDMTRGGEFFAYLQLQFLVVERNNGSQTFKAVYDGSTPRLATMQRVSGFMEQVGRNTNYIIHPEEILADNFALLVLHEQNVASPDILHKMRAILMRKAAP